LKFRKKIQPLFSSFLLIVMVSGCAPWSQRPAGPGPVASNGAAVARHCPDRFQRARTGGFVGTVFGVVAGSLMGGPIIAGVYKMAGYVMGFASADNCAQKGFVVQRAGPVETAEPPWSPEPIREETLKVSARP